MTDTAQKVTLETQHANVPNRYAQAAGRWLVSGPAALAMTGALILVYTASLIFPFHGIEALVAAGAGDHWWSIFTAWAAVRSPGQLILDIVLLLTLGILLERLLGTARYLLIGFVSYWLGGLITFGLVRLLEVLLPTWGEVLSGETVVGVAAYLLAVAAGASAQMAPLWSRRLQVFVITILVVLVLFAGYLSALFAVVVTLLGLAMGRLLYGRSSTRVARKDLVGAGPQDSRFLVALIVGGIVIGNALALTTTHMTGLLASLQYYSLGLADTQNLGTCAETALVNCEYYRGLSGYTGLQLLLPILMQLALAWGLRYGRRSALVGTVLLQGTAVCLAVANLIILWRTPEHWEAYGFNQAAFSLTRLAATVVIPLFILGLVLASRKLFTVRSKPGVFRKFWLTILLWTAIGWILATVAGLLLTGLFDVEEVFLSITKTYLLHLLPAPSLAVEVAANALQVPALLEVATTIAANLALLPWAVGTLLLLSAFRQRELPQSISRSRFIQLTRKYGAGSMGWISTWEGNHYWGAPGGRGAVAYRSTGGVALTVTDPVAAPGDLEDVMEQFVSFALQQGLVPAFYSIHEDSMAVTKRWGWPELQVAEETLLDLPELAFTGKKFQDVRTASNRAKKEGIEARWVTYADCPPELWNQIEQISKQWVGDKPLPEMGFTLGGLAELNDPEVPMLLAVDEEDRVHGVTSWMPIYEGGQVIGWTLDFMRRLDGGFRPVMEFLIASAALWAKEQGYSVLSLSGAPLAKAESDKGTEVPKGTTVDNVLGVVGGLLEPVYGFRSLLRFKAKFRPRYEPVYLSVPTLGSLPVVGIAISSAYLPEMSPVETAELARVFVKR